MPARHAADRPHATLRRVMRYVLATFYMSAGILHFARPEKFLPVVPAWVPLPHETVLLTGACEIAGSVALLIGPTMAAAGVMLALYAVCVYPANIKHALEGIHLPPVPDSWWYHGPRLALQPVLVWWALFCAGIVDWPFGARSDRR